MKLEKSLSIIPPEGCCWVPHGPYGLERYREGFEGRLLRLHDLLSWMAHKLEWPRKKAIYAVFSHLIQLDEADAPYRRQVIFVINSDDYALPLSVGNRLNPKTKEFWAELPYSYPDATAWGTVREIADLWDECWPGYVEHSDDFYRVGWIDYCKRMKALARSSEGPDDWEDVYRTQYFMSLEDWVKRCKKFIHSFGRLAVPFAVAHELWSWGTVVEEAPASPFPLADWPALVRFRKGQRGLDWGQGNQIAVALTELGQRKALGQTESDALDAMAKEMGLSGRESLRKPLKLSATNSGRKRETKKAAGTVPHVIAVRDGRKVA